MNRSSLEKFTVPQLKDKLKQKGLTISGRKDELIDRLIESRNQSKIPDNVVDKKLYCKIKQEVKSRVKRWPSAYASGQLVKEYMERGGRYDPPRTEKNSNLQRWYKEKWVNVCEKDSKGNYKPCGRKQANIKNYPYCRPLIRVNSKTPKLAGELTKNELNKRCKNKKSNPLLKIK